MSDANLDDAIEMTPTCQNGGCADETFAMVDDPLDRGWISLCARHTIQAAVVVTRMSQAAGEALQRVLADANDTGEQDDRG